jgi:LPXTG-motif cell wall-anchored protein
MPRQFEEVIVRHPVRRFAGVALIGVLGALFAMPLLPAGAQEGGPPPSPGDCTFTATGTAPGPVHVEVITPAGASEVVVTFAPSEGDPTPQVFTQPAPAGGGTVTFDFDVTVPGLVTANFVFGNQNAYATGCTGPGGSEAIAISGVSDPGGAASLAFTGSSDTPTYVLIGLAALVIGAVFVVAARRRSQVS